MQTNYTCILPRARAFRRCIARMYTFSFCCTVHYYNDSPWDEHPQSCPFLWGISMIDPLLIHGSFDPPESSTKRQLDRFSRFCTTHGRVSLYFTMGRHLSPQNCPFSGIYTPFNTWFLGPQLSLSPAPNGISIGSAVFTGLKNVTNRHTHRRTTLLFVYQIRWYYLAAHRQRVNMPIIVVKFEEINLQLRKVRKSY